MHYWGGRFEKSVAFTSMLFNQMQRHAAVQKAARVGVTHEYPESTEAKWLKAGLLRLLSLVGGSVPFSPSERAATRPKLGAMRYRYGIALHWVTIAPPEHDDLLLHRIAVLREQTAWNDSNCVFARKECMFEDFPLSLRDSARARLKVSVQYPALSAQVFERRVKSLTRDIIRCRDSKLDTRK
ncbi:hypothetical protein PHYPSEUDO_010867 [Phytophthora pseudosyringae]|uniref:Uncharacterized protein n=1 Tax=Phytophthora pseudosyringae TaxID=221518 RepID=A0A8T1VCT0_9STRA|nr:hypothetical protein PHYPSEUDO_010867 [Phytophthora pseudosyringae]